MDYGQEKKREDEQRQQKYERKMQLAYPDIVNRLSLYMGAGISIRHAWERIIRGYEKQRQMTGNSEDAYEQMKLALRQMQNGVAETVAYEQFGMDWSVIFLSEAWNLAQPESAPWDRQSC